MRVIESLQIGDLRIIQDTELYRFTSDSVLLARFPKAKKGDRVADFCAGSGIVGLHFYGEHPEIASVTFFEADEALAAMCGESIALNGLEGVCRTECVRLQEIPARYTEAFSLILCNPPYERAGSGFQNADEGKAPCRKELSLTLDELIAAAAKCLKFGGRLSVIYRADRVSELLCAMHVRNLEPKTLQFVAGKEGAKPYAALVTAKKGAAPGVDVLPAHINQTPARRGK